MTERYENRTTGVTHKPVVLVTGATGYVGGRLVGHIDPRRFRVRCLARKPEYIRDRLPPGIELAAGDALDSGTLPDALRGVGTAYYLIHSMGSSGDFEEKDRRAAGNFGEAARAAGVRRIIYLGGLSDPDEPLSAHLRSRHEVGETLRGYGVQVIEFRASIVLGSGSLSFELIRALTERLPVMTTPRWVSVPAQPIAIDDLLGYLVAAIDIDVDGHRVFEIGGRDVVSYRGLIEEYARQRGLKRVLLPVPVLTPGLSSRWLGLVTPLYARVGRKLIDGVRHPTLVRDDTARKIFAVEPMGVRDAIATALRNEDRDFAETRWSDALSSGDTLREWGGVRFGSRIVDSRTAEVRCEPARAFEVVERIGGKNGWYYADWLWRARGFIDLLVGGVGMRRGRRDAATLRAGDVVDCWRVESVIPGRKIRFFAEMKLPGRAWLEFDFSGGGGRTTIRQTAVFDPLGLGGLLYWYALYAVHQVIFAGMLRRIARAASAARSAPPAVAPARRESLPVLLSEDPRALPAPSVMFGNENPVEVELGCGKAKFLIARAVENPAINFLGIDAVWKWMKYAVERSEKRGVGNIRFLRADAREAVKYGIPAGSVSVFHIYFPDPWPKRRQQKRRLVTGEFLRVLHERLTDGGLVELATDHSDYFARMQAAVIHSGIAWKNVRTARSARLFGASVDTNYEIKYRAEGRELYYLELEK